ncbi:MAG: group II intron maturase-specific domain-containing protein [Crocosphaera sp.]
MTNCCRLSFSNRLYVIKDHKKAPQEALISRLNPIIRGWCNYYRTVASKETLILGGDRV